MLNQTGLARPAAILVTAVALIAAANVALVLAARPSLPLPAPVAPRAPVATEQMSLQALAQYRAFYAQQLASEAMLERWSLPEEAAQGRTTQQQRFHAEQMASEAALGRWSSAWPESSPPRPPEAPQRLTAGVPFE